MFMYTGYSTGDLEIHNYSIIAHSLLYGNDLLAFFYTSFQRRD